MKSNRTHRMGEAPKVIPLVLVLASLAMSGTSAPKPLFGPTTPSSTQPHARYLGEEWDNSLFDFGVLPRVELEADVEFRVRRSIEPDENGFPLYSLKFDWTWMPDLGSASADIFDEVTTTYSTDYRPTCVNWSEDGSMVVAGVDRRGCVLIEQWVLGGVQKRVVHDGNGVVIDRILVPLGVRSRGRGFRDDSGVLAPINGMGRIFSDGTVRWLPVRSHPSGVVSVLQVGAQQSGLFVPLFGPSDIAPVDPNDPGAVQFAERLADFWDPAILYAGIEREIDVPQPGDCTYLLVPHPLETEVRRVPVLVLEDHGDDLLIDRATMGAY